MPPFLGEKKKVELEPQPGDVLGRPQPFTFDEIRRPSGDTPSQEGEGELVLEVAVPTHSPFYFTIAIDDDLHLDPMLSSFVCFDSGHGGSPRLLALFALAA